MPFIEVKAIKGVFSGEEKQQIIEEVTGVFGRLKGDDFVQGTWVVINEHVDGNWGEAGIIVTRDDVLS